jgi:hypothetical protein
MGVVILTTGGDSDDEDMFASKLVVLLSGHFGCRMKQQRGEMFDLKWIAAVEVKLNSLRSIHTIIERAATESNANSEKSTISVTSNLASGDLPNKQEHAKYEIQY